ncbi:FkbM family methyltransferase [Rhodobacteraceae bacterium B1Z28]|uniref:FkbM family methyltransferase n=1 Tax=Ruegeria haliotis TaxID=2747601 RepID=A0ABX2PV16_9RHOB|nr:FkbM family methyltransferase [Ruegeria haliotis]NVO57644.1 FkbM family methyltransferase [Ruegeria haliotis]
MQDHFTLRGVRIPNDPQIITPQVKRSILAERYEKDEVTGLPKFIDPKDRVVELGAGIGFISSFLVTQLGVRNAMCIEANPTLCEFIGRVHQANGMSNVDVLNAVALSDTQTLGTANFYVREPFWSSSLDPEPEYVKEVDVPKHYLSTLLREFDANTLIVDIEGGEKVLFDGADLVNVQKVYLEVHTRKIGLRGIKACFDALSDLGFAYDQRVSSGGSVLFRRIGRR